MTHKKGGEWPGKEDLPDPATLLALLIKGERCDVNGHCLIPDEHGVWITNPYGIDCGLWQELSIQRVEAFLTDMARGEEYGPVP